MKNIAISDEVYQRLKALKKPWESFTQVIDRMTRSKGVLVMSRTLTKAEASRVREVVKETTKESLRRLRGTAEKLV